MIWAKRSIVVSLLSLSLITGMQAQDFGISFSYFIPKNGYFSNPVTPFSVRGLGFNLGRYFALESGFSLYRMAGMNIKDLPFESNDPLMGPFFSIMVPAELVLQFDFGRQVIRFRGGVFGFFNFSNRINEGNFDRALMAEYGYRIANTDLEFENKLGGGYHFGGEYVIYVTDKFGVSFDVNYFIGGSDLNLQGEVTFSDGGLPITETLDYPDARLDFTGLEISIGVLITAGRR